MKVYTIVEFEEGIEMVPTVWITNDQKTCLWPDLKSQIRINTCIANKEHPDSENGSILNWLSYRVLKIFGSASTYERGKEKLKLAEQLDDVGTATVSEQEDSSVLRKTRHSRAIRTLSSSDEMETASNYPAVPPLLSKRNVAAVTGRGVVEKTAVASVSQRDSQTTSNLASQHRVNSRENEKKTNATSRKTREILSRETSSDENDNTVIETTKPRQQIPEVTRSSATSQRGSVQNNNQMSNISAAKFSSFAESQITQQTITLEQVFAVLKDICLKLNFMKTKIASIQSEIRDVRDIISTDQNRAAHDVDLDELGLPLGTSEKLKDFEKELSNSDFCHAMIKALKVIGGGDIQTIVSNILAKLLSNTIAERFSFKGHKGKTPFKDFHNIVNLIAKVARNHKPQATDKEITEAISTWLAQAKTRRVREEAKLAKRQAEKEARSQGLSESDDQA